MKKIAIFLIVLAFGLSFFATNSMATVELDADITYVPAERTMRIGAAGNGEIHLTDIIEWEAAQDYVSGNRMKVWLTPASANLEFADTYGFQFNNANGMYTRQLNVDGANTFILQLNTVASAANTFEIGDTNLDAPRVDVNPMNPAPGQVVSVNGVALTSGLGTIDADDSDVILQTVTQFSAWSRPTAVSTIDVVDTNGRVFLTGSATAQPYPFAINEWGGFDGSTNHCPTFAGTDILTLVLEGTNAFQGVSQVLLVGTDPANGTSTITRNIPGFVSVNGPWTITYSGGAIGGVVNTANAGNNGVDLGFNIVFLSNKTQELATRKVDVDATLKLGGTGNGVFLGPPQLTVSYPNRIQFVQNGALYATNMFKKNANGNNTFYKFSNSSNNNIQLEMWYIPSDNDTTNAASTDWVTYTGDGGMGIPANSQITISAPEAAADFGFADNTYDGRILFRAKGSPQWINAMVNCKNANGSFNAPMYFQREDNNNNLEWQY